MQMKASTDLHTNLKSLESTIYKIVDKDYSTPELAKVRVKKAAKNLNLNFSWIINNKYPSQEELTGKIREIILKIEKGEKPLCEVPGHEVALAQPIQEQLMDLQKDCQPLPEDDHPYLKQLKKRSRCQTLRTDLHNRPHHLIKYGTWSNSTIEKLIRFNRDYRSSVNEKRIKMALNKLHHQAYGPGPYKENVSFLEKLKDYCNSIGNTPYNISKGFSSLFIRSIEIRQYFTRDIYDFMIERKDKNARSEWWNNRKESIHLWNMAKNNSNKEKPTSFYEKTNIEYKLFVYTPEYRERINANLFMRGVYKFADLFKPKDPAYSTVGIN
jgi:hypothetical protein